MRLAVNEIIRKKYKRIIFKIQKHFFQKMNKKRFPIIRKMNQNLIMRRLLYNQELKVLNQKLKIKMLICKVILQTDNKYSTSLIQKLLKYHPIIIVDEI